MGHVGSRVYGHGQAHMSIEWHGPLTVRHKGGIALLIDGRIGPVNSAHGPWRCCANEPNNVAQPHNIDLWSGVNDLNRSLPHVKIVYVDVTLTPTTL